MQHNLFSDYENALTYLSVNEHTRLSRIALEVNWRLSRVYDVPDYDAARLCLVDQLIYAILSQRTRAQFADQAFAALLVRFPDRISILNAPAIEIERMIEMTTYPDRKARWLLGALPQVLEWNGGRRLSLEFLCDLPDFEAAALLRELRGVSWKTSNAVMLLSREKRALLPVDTHGWRVRSRIGIISEKVTETKLIHAIARAVLPVDWKSREIEREYFLIKRHGQNCCTYSSPKCFQCPLLDLCEHGKKMLNTTRTRILN